jgi:peptidoglycan/xylan/chitin deacetylase (PgdA/CDA1 family)
MTTRPVPILLYHSVDQKPSRWIAPFTITPEVFQEHLDVIASLNCQPLTVSALVDCLRSERPLPARPVIITFDDGFADMAATVAPGLARRGFPATLYVTTAALLGGPIPTPHRLPPAAMLSWDQLSRLEADGIEVGAHTLTHPALDTVSERTAFTEIGGSKAALEEALGHPVRSFAYPHGHHDRRVTTLVRRAGFDSACAVKNTLSSAADDQFALSRMTVMAVTSAGCLEQWLLGQGAPLWSPRTRWRTRAGRQYRRFVSRAWP